MKVPSPWRFIFAGFLALILMACEEQDAPAEEPAPTPEPDQVEPEPEKEKEAPAPAPVEEKEEEEKALQTHEEIIDRLIDLQKSFLKSLSVMITSGETEAFMKGLDTRRDAMSALLVEAKALPEPASGDRAYYKTAREAFADEGIAAMDKYAAKLRALPEESEIRKVFASLSQDEDIPELQAQFDRLYK